MSNYREIYDAIARACQHYEKDADGFCIQCGWGSEEAILERDLAGCNEHVQQLQDEVNFLMDENAKLRKLCVDAAELLSGAGDVQVWLVKCSQALSRFEEACDV